MAAERNKFKVAAMGTSIHGTAIRRVTTMDDLINIFHNNRSGSEVIFNDFIIIS